MIKKYKVVVMRYCFEKKTRYYIVDSHINRDQNKTWYWQPAKICIIVYKILSKVNFWILQITWNKEYILKQHILRKPIFFKFAIMLIKIFQISPKFNHFIFFLPECGIKRVLEFSLKLHSHTILIHVNCCIWLKVQQSHTPPGNDC